MTTTAPVVGRRKEAIVRVRLAPGTGEFKLNGRTLEGYFPNKVHQQLIREPFVTLEKDGQYDVIAVAVRRRRHRPGRCAAPGDRPRADRPRARRPSGPEEGRLPDPRRAGQGAQEVRPEEGPQGPPVLQALSRVGSPLRDRRRPGSGQRRSDAELALSLAGAAARVLVAHDASHRPVAVVGRDPRASGEMLEAAVSAGLAAAGADVLRVGVLPTPAVAYLTGAYGADLGVVLSASHNPMPDNGIKLFARGGHKLPDDIEIEIEQAMDDGPSRRPTGAGVGRLRDADDAAERYLAHLLAGRADVAGRRARRRRLRARRGVDGRARAVPAGRARP